MKKLLSLLGVVGLTTTAASSAMAFTPNNQTNHLVDQQMEGVENTYLLINDTPAIENQSYSFSKNSSSINFSLSDKSMVDQLSFISNLSFKEYFHLAYPNARQGAYGSSSVGLQLKKELPAEGIDVTIYNTYTGKKYTTVKIIKNNEPEPIGNGYQLKIDDKVMSRNFASWSINHSGSMRISLANGFGMDQLNINVSKEGYLAFNFPTWNRVDSPYVDVSAIKPTTSEGVILTITKAYDNSPFEQFTIRLFVFPN